MVDVIYQEEFQRTFTKIKHATLVLRIKNHIQKIMSDPEIGKPVRYSRKNTREVHIPPFRLMYSYDKEQDVLYIIDLYHKDEQ